MSEQDSTGATRRDWLTLLVGTVTLVGTRDTLAQARPGGEVLLGGTGAGIGPLRKVLEDVPKLRFVPNLGTGGGLKALAAGAIDIALAARPLNDAERSQGLVQRELFRTPVVWAVHEGVPLRQVSIAELAALYAGATHQWSNGIPVRLVLRPESDSDSRLLKTLGPELAAASVKAQQRPGAHVAVTDTDTTEALERIAGSIGVTTLGLVRAEGRRLHVLDVQGVKPSAGALVSGRYPYVKVIYATTRNPVPALVADVLAQSATRKAAQAMAALDCVAASAG